MHMFLKVGFTCRSFFFFWGGVGCHITFCQKIQTDGEARIFILTRGKKKTLSTVKKTGNYTRNDISCGLIIALVRTSDLDFGYLAIIYNILF